MNFPLFSLGFVDLYYFDRLIADLRCLARISDRTHHGQTNIFHHMGTVLESICAIFYIALSCSSYLYFERSFVKVPELHERKHTRVQIHILQQPSKFYTFRSCD
jgi:hypothetical protein